MAEEKTMTKPEVIARLQHLSGALGRDIDVSGSLAELELRLREAEEEFAAINDDDTGDAGAQASAAPEDCRPVSEEQQKGSFQVSVKKCLHLHVCTPRGRLSKLVVPGDWVAIDPADFDAKTMTKGG